VVAELGPGHSLGAGLAALLCGADRYCALDRSPLATAGTPDCSLEELVALFTRREAVPGELELPAVRPLLSSYEFPHRLLDEPTLEAALAPARVQAIAAALDGLRTGEQGGLIEYHAPWSSRRRIRRESVDHLFSQAVLEHVDDVAGAYRGMHRWLRPGGVMSHQIDFRSHATSELWNGHWGIPSLKWAVIRGRRGYLINRLPLSGHLRAMERAGFEIVGRRLVTGGKGLARADLAARFSDISDEDLQTSGAFVVAIRR
jgi:hypothetical protein